jgi:transcriptional regulator with PAS, ATPase and Fis domain
MLRAHFWPGNVRELENVMKRVAALHAGDRSIDAATLLPFLTDHSTGSGNVNGNGHSTPVTDERAAILTAYRDAHGNKSRLAGLLGVSRKTLYARLKRLDLTLP